MIDYVGVDYGGAVSEGEIASDLEYGEMQEFAKRVAAGVRELEAGSEGGELAALARRLEAAIAGKVAAAEIIALTRRMRGILTEQYDIVQLPPRPPDPARAQALYAQQCAACHGINGKGNGTAAVGLDPPPTDFRDVERARQRSVFGLFNTITRGVDGTAMAGFDALPAADRWSLAFYVGGFAAHRPAGAPAQAVGRAPGVSLRDAVTLSPAELGERVPNGEIMAFALRKGPAALFGAPADPLAVAVEKLNQSLQHYRRGDRAAADRLALGAYLDGVELSEAAIMNVSRMLMRDLERAMLDYRRAVSSGAAVAEVESRLDAAQGLIAEARSALSETTLSVPAAFASSLIILLREGLEAIVVLAAMLAFLIRTERRDALVYVHAGWIAALVAGIGTWIVSSYAFNISGATREVTEGIAALAAAAILFYVGFWMHRNADMARWSRYLHGKLRAALGRQTLWTICLVSFLAVYREVFETMLFYEALWLQLTPQAHGAVFAGGAVAVILLLAVIWIIARTGMRLPMRQFFLASAALMVGLAFLFAGAGVGALQEAGKIPSRPLDVPGIEYIGIHPTVQAAAVQLLLLALAVGLVLYERRGNRAV